MLMCVTSSCFERSKLAVTLIALFRHHVAATQNAVRQEDVDVTLDSRLPGAWATRPTRTCSALFWRSRSGAVGRVASVMTIMKLSDEYDDFEVKLDRVHP